MAIQIYGEIDRRADGKPRGFKPSWAEKPAIEALKEDIAGTERALKMGRIPASEVHLAEERVRKGTERLGEIEKGRPVLNDQQRDAVARERKRLSVAIGDSLFTHTEMDMGFADAHEEVARMTEKRIELDPEQAKESGVTLVNGKGSRNDAAKMYQHLSYALGESPDIERLRRTGKRGSNVTGTKNAKE